MTESRFRRGFQDSRVDPFHRALIPARSAVGLEPTARPRHQESNADSVCQDTAGILDDPVTRGLLFTRAGSAAGALPTGFRASRTVKKAAWRSERYSRPYDGAKEKYGSPQPNLLIHLLHGFSFCLSDEASETKSGTFMPVAMFLSVGITNFKTSAIRHGRKLGASLRDAITVDASTPANLRTTAPAGIKRADAANSAAGAI